MKKLIITLFVISGTARFSPAQTVSSPVVLRVAIVNTSPQIKLAVRGPFRIHTLYTDELLDTYNFIRPTEVFPAKEGIRIGKKEYKIFAVKLKPTKDTALSINNRLYRGEIDIIRTKEMELLLINHIELEKYLYGVLYHEVSHRWPLEVLKSQAIASRTYALYQKSVSQNKDYDLTADFYSQVYGGKTSEKYRTTKAVNLTKGTILTYKGNIFPTYFHATCAGATEDASELWDINLPVLKGAKCDFCYRSPHYRWENFITQRELKKKLSAAGYNDIGKILAIIPAEKNASGRIKILSIISDRGKLKILAKDFRHIFNPQIIRSTNFEVEVEPDGALFRGYGWGHGVGLCQWGAYFMALKGTRAEEILKFYYPGTEISNLATGPQTANR
jgi:stage II sporulation protein D